MQDDLLDNLNALAADECEKLVREAANLDVAYIRDRKDNGNRLTQIVKDNFERALESLQGGDDGNS